MKSAYPFLVSCLLLGFHLNAQYSFHNFKQLTQENGLPSSYTSELVEDKYGFIWIGTGKGLVRYDGNRVQVVEELESDSVSLQNTYISTLAVKGDSLWVGTQNGLFILNLVNGSLSKTPLDTDHFPKEVDSSNRHQVGMIWDIYEDRQGNMWLAQTFGGFTKWEKATQSFHNYPVFPDPNIPKTYTQSNQTTLVNLIQDVNQDSIIWGASMSGLMRLNQESGKIQRIIYPHEDEKKQFIINRKICIHQTPDGTIYSGSWTGGLSIYYPPTGKYIYPEVPNQLKGNHLYGIMDAGQDKLYMNFMGGFYIYNYGTGHFRLLQENNSRGEIKQTYGIEFIDSQQRAWYATGTGVLISDPMVEQFQWFSIADYNNNKVPSIIRSLVEGFYPGYISFSGQFSDGIYHVNTQNRHVLKQEMIPYVAENDNFKSWGLTAFDDQTLLISGSRKLYTLHKDKARIELYRTQIPLQFSNLKNGVRDSTGIVWLGSNSDGLFSLNPKTGKLQSYKSQIPYTSVGRLFLDRDQNVWMLSKSGHLVFNRHQNNFNFFDLKQDSATTFLYGRNYCECPNGEIWLSGELEGIGLLSSKHPEKGIIKKIPIKNENGEVVLVKHIACSPKNELWGINAGVLLKINRNDGTCLSFNFDYGIKRWEGEFQFLQTGELFIGARDGFYTIQPEKLAINTRLPKPYVNKITSNRGNLNRITDHINQVPVYIKPNEKVITIEFSAINHTMASKTKYAYQLDGVDEDWIDPGDKRALIYSYIPGGQYIFKLKAANNEGLWSPVYSLPINVGVPWYQTLIFQIGLIAVIIGGAVGLYRRRIRQIEKANVLKSEFEKKVADLEMSALRAQMNPHFIFNCLNSIEAYIIRNDTKKASEYLNAFGRLVRLILQNSRSSYINLQEELQSIRLYLELEQMRFKNSFSYEIDLKDNLNPEEYEVPPMLIQPFIENAIWHGLNHRDDGGVVKVEITQQAEVLRCIIEDNGIGRVAAQQMRAAQTVKRQSMGMDITMARIQTINKIYDTNNEVQIEDLYDAEQKATGTRITLNISI